MSEERGGTPVPEDVEVEKETEKYCPLSMVMKEDGTHLFCGKELCAWWVETWRPGAGACAVPFFSTMLKDFYSANPSLHDTVFEEVVKASKEREG